MFRCYDGHLTPFSIGIKDKKIVKRMLFIIKLSTKLIRMVTLGFSVLAVASDLYLFFLNNQVNDGYELIAFLFWFPVSAIGLYFLTSTLLVTSLCFQIITYHCLIITRHYNKFRNFQSNMSYGFKRAIIKLKIMFIIKQQNEFSIRILKYNKFWKKFYMIMMIHFLPSNIICLQQALFGDLSIQLRILFWICFFIGMIVIVSTSLFASLLSKEIKIFRKKLIQFQFDRHLSLNILTKLKVI